MCATYWKRNRAITNSCLVEVKCARIIFLDLKHFSGNLQYPELFLLCEKANYFLDSHLWKYVKYARMSFGNPKHLVARLEVPLT